jgi:Type II restriction endonuclease EcoO109I
MDKVAQDELIAKAQAWFRQTILPNHIANTRKLADPNEFDANPLLAPYIATFLEGELTAESVAKALIYPRVLGTSITTSFGQNMQTFISDVLINTFGSLIKGIDIEFTDATDGHRKYCQVKLGPKTINRDDVQSIHGHFESIYHLSKTNKAKISVDDLVVGIVYGEPGDENGHYQRIRNEYHHPVYIGRDFWHRLTGDQHFYERLIKACSEVALEAKGKELINSTIASLAASPLAKSLAAK